MPDALGLCPTVAQAKTTSLVKNGMVTISASDYCDRVNDAFSQIGATKYTASLTKGTDGTTLDMDIRYGKTLVGCVKFCVADKDDSWITYRQRNSSKTFNEMALLVFVDSDDGAEYFFYTAIALAMAIDPSLDKYDAKDIVDYLVDHATQKSGTYMSSCNQNSIRYAFMLDDDCFIVVDCSDA